MVVFKHQVNSEQMSSVLDQFDATTMAIRGIESKMTHMQGYLVDAKKQQERFTQQAEEATGIMDHLSNSLIGTSNEVIENCASALDTFAGLIENLEQTASKLGPMNALKELQLELVPLLVPIVVLVMVLTICNCYFGFLLAADEDLVRTFALQTMFGQGADEEFDDEELTDDFNMLSVFASFHLVLICIAVLYLGVEACRRICVPGSSKDVRTEVLEDEMSDSSLESTAQEGECPRPLPRFEPFTPRGDGLTSGEIGQAFRTTQGPSMSPRVRRLDGEMATEPSVVQVEPPRLVYSTSSSSKRRLHTDQSGSKPTSAAKSQPPISSFLRSWQQNAATFAARRKEQMADVGMSPWNVIAKTLATTEFSEHRGFAIQGRDVLVATMTLAEARAKTSELQGCHGFSYLRRETANGRFKVHFRFKQGELARAVDWNSVLHSRRSTTNSPSL